MDTLTLFSKNLNQRSLTPRWPLTPCLLKSHVWLYPRIIVSKSHDNTSMYVDTVMNFANYHIHTYIHILHTYYVHVFYYVQNEWSHSLLLNSVQARQKQQNMVKQTYNKQFKKHIHTTKWNKNIFALSHRQYFCQCSLLLPAFISCPQVLTIIFPRCTFAICPSKSTEIALHMWNSNSRPGHYDVKHTKLHQTYGIFWMKY